MGKQDPHQPTNLHNGIERCLTLHYTIALVALYIIKQISILATDSSPLWYIGAREVFIVRCFLPILRTVKGASPPPDSPMFTSLNDLTLFFYNQCNLSMMTPADTQWCKQWKQWKHWPARLRLRSYWSVGRGPNGDC